MKPVAFTVALLSAGLLQLVTAESEVAAGEAEQAAIVGGELSAIANQLSLRPESALDFSEVSGEYCFDVSIGEGGHMTHYAIDPSNTQEDVIDFVNAEPMLEAGVNLDNLPRFPGGLGTMTPNQWYFLPAGEFEPHHGMEFPFPLLIRASDLE